MDADLIKKEEQRLEKSLEAKSKFRGKQTAAKPAWKIKQEADLERKKQIAEEEAKKKRRRYDCS